MSNESSSSDTPKLSSFDQWIKKLGPGLITGAADDDPSGIATYSQAGSQFGNNMLWTVLFTYPLMVGIQIISAHIGRITGKGLTSNIRSHYPRWLLGLIVSLLVVANTINIAADISAMGDAMTLITGHSPQFYTITFGIISLMLQVWIPYHRYVFFLKWLTLSLFSYVATMLILNVPWLTVLKDTLAPTITLSSEYLTTVVAVFGTTISPYLFFWQAAQEVEEKRTHPHSMHSFKTHPEEVSESFRRIKIDTYVGMGFSNLVAFFIILTAASTLHTHGIQNIQTSADAAAALRPLAGEFAFVLFSLGIIGTGMLAIPVLAGSAAYAVAESMQWRNSLELKPSRAKGFYSIIAISTIIGTALTFTKINPIKALYWSAVLNGVISIPIMVIMMMISARKDIMGELTLSRRLAFLGWACVGVMLLAVIAMFIF